MFGELLLGKAPLPDVEGEEISIRELLLMFASQTHLQPFARPASMEAESCIKGFLTVPPTKRLTSVDALKAHPFFKGARRWGSEDGPSPPH